jgi:hypothetical protein
LFSKFWPFCISEGWHHKTVYVKIIGSIWTTKLPGVMRYPLKLSQQIVCLPLLVYVMKQPSSEECHIAVGP